MTTTTNSQADNERDEAAFDAPSPANERDDNESVTSLADDEEVGKITAAENKIQQLQLRDIEEERRELEVRVAGALQQPQYGKDDDIFAPAEFTEVELPTEIRSGDWQAVQGEWREIKGETKRKTEMYGKLGFDAFRSRIIAAHACTFSLDLTSYEDVLFPPPLNPFEPKPPLPRALTHDEINHLPRVTLKVFFPMKIVLATQFYPDGEYFEQPDTHTCDWWAMATIRNGAIMQRRISRMGVMYDTRQAFRWTNPDTGEEEKRVIFKWTFVPADKSPLCTTLMSFTTPEKADKLNRVRPRLTTQRKKKTPAEEEQEDLEKAAAEAGLDIATMDEESKQSLRNLRKEIKLKEAEAKRARKDARAAERAQKARRKEEKKAAKEAEKERLKAAKKAAKKAAAAAKQAPPAAAAAAESSSSNRLTSETDAPLLKNSTSLLAARNAAPDEPLPEADDDHDF